MMSEAAALQSTAGARLQPVARERKQKTARFLPERTAGASSGANPLLRQHHCNLDQGQAERERERDCSTAPDNLHFPLITVGALERLVKELY